MPGENCGAAFPTPQYDIGFQVPDLENCFFSVVITQFFLSGDVFCSSLAPLWHVVAGKAKTPEEKTLSEFIHTEKPEKTAKKTGVGGSPRKKHGWCFYLQYTSEQFGIQPRQLKDRIRTASPRRCRLRGTMHGGVGGPFFQRRKFS